MQQSSLRSRASAYKPIYERTESQDLIEAVCILAIALCQLGELQAAEQLLLDTLNGVHRTKAEKRAFYWILRSEVCEEMKQLDKAALCFQMAAKFKAQPFSAVIKSFKAFKLRNSSVSSSQMDQQKHATSQKMSTSFSRAMTLPSATTTTTTSIKSSTGRRSVVSMPRSITVTRTDAMAVDSSTRHTADGSGTGTRRRRKDTPMPGEQSTAKQSRLRSRQRQLDAAENAKVKARIVSHSSHSTHSLSSQRGTSSGLSVPKPIVASVASANGTGTIGLSSLSQRQVQMQSRGRRMGVVAMDSMLSQFQGQPSAILEGDDECDSDFEMRDSTVSIGSSASKDVDMHSSGLPSIMDLSDVKCKPPPSGPSFTSVYGIASQMATRPLSLKKKKTTHSDQSTRTAAMRTMTTDLGKRLSISSSTTPVPTASKKSRAILPKGQMKTVPVTASRSSVTMQEAVVTSGFIRHRISDCSSLSDADTVELESSVICPEMDARVTAARSKEEEEEDDDIVEIEAEEDDSSFMQVADRQSSVASMRGSAIGARQQQLATDSSLLPPPTPLTSMLSERLSEFQTRRTFDSARTSLKTRSRMQRFRSTLPIASSTVDVSTSKVRPRLAATRKKKESGTIGGSGTRPQSQSRSQATVKRSAIATGTVAMASAFAMGSESESGTAMTDARKELKRSVSNSSSVDTSDMDVDTDENALIDKVVVGSGTFQIQPKRTGQKKAEESGSAMLGLGLGVVSDSSTGFYDSPVQRPVLADISAWVKQSPEKKKSGTEDFAEGELSGKRGSTVRMEVLKASAAQLKQLGSPCIMSPVRRSLRLSRLKPQREPVSSSSSEGEDEQREQSVTEGFKPKYAFVPNPHIGGIM